MARGCGGVVASLLWLTLALSLATHNTALGKVQHLPGTPLPSFAEPIGNITVIKGRHITFTCIVKHLGPYKVGWVKADTKAIQAIHHQVVTHNPRVSVTYRDRTTWNLHIRAVQEDDRGLYMCQVNTDPMIAEIAYLDVVVPPEIIDNATSGETTVEEGHSVTLTCKAKGHPTPKVSWKMEGGREITLREQGNKRVLTWEGEELTLTKVKRSDMGAYLCIAKNGIPPSVSKRIMLRVTFSPLLEVPVHMIGSPIGKAVTLRCRVESSPRAVTTWRKEPGDQMIISSSKHNVTERHEGFYVTHMGLTIKNFTKEDATTYRCVASNSLGASASSVQVYDIQPQKPRVSSKDVDEGHLDNRIPDSPAEFQKEINNINNNNNNNNNIEVIPNEEIDIGRVDGAVIDMAPEMNVGDVDSSDYTQNNFLFPYLSCGPAVGVGVGVWVGVWVWVWAV